MWRPFAFTHAWQRRLIDATKVFRNAWRMLFQMLVKARAKSANVTGWFSKRRKRLSISSQTCSIGDKSGDSWPRQGIDNLLNKQVPDYTCNVWPCVVLLQSDVILMSLYEGYHMTLNNFISIAYAGEISILKLKYFILNMHLILSSRILIFKKKSRKPPRLELFSNKAKTNFRIRLRWE